MSGRTGVLCSIVAAGAISTGHLLAQPQAGSPATPAPSAQIQARHEISAMEGVLENAVKYGGQMLGQRLQASNAQDVVMLTGIAHARGFRLEGYGVLFDVEFPSIRRSVMWSMRALQRPDPELLVTLQELRRNMESIADRRARQELDRAIRDFEAQLKVFDEQSKAPQAASQVTAASTSREAAAVDPRRLYLSEISSALIDAIIDHGAPIRVAPDEWLTIAARESDTRRFVPDDPTEAVMTFVLRINGRDLAAIRDQHLPREEARKHVEITQY